MTTDMDISLWPTGWPHEAPEEPLTVAEAHLTMQRHRGCLREEDREIELRPKSFEVLRYLIANAGRLVPKRELIGHVWPSVVVTEDSLSRCISERWPSESSTWDLPIPIQPLA